MWVSPPRAGFFSPVIRAERATAMAENEKKGTPTEEELPDNEDEDFAADRAQKAEQAEVTRPPNRG